MGSRMVMGKVLMVLLICTLFLGIFTTPVSAYELVFVDGDWDGGDKDEGGDNVGYSDSDFDASNGELEFMCRAEVYGHYWAWAYVYKNFTYDAADSLNTFTVKYHRRGSATWLGGDVSIYIRVELYDRTAGGVPIIVYGDDKDLDFGDFRWTPDNYKTVGFATWLTSGHEYQVILRGKGDCDVSFPAVVGSQVDFKTYEIGGDDFRVDWVHLKVYHEDPSTEESVGGVWVPIDRFALLAPYAGVASTILVGTVVAIILIKRVRSQKDEPQVEA